MNNLDRLTPTEQKALLQFKEKLAQVCGPQGWELRVFGSRARGEGSEDSDLDMLVLLQTMDQKKKIQIWDAAYEIFDSTDVLLSPHVLSYQQYENMKNRERLIAKDIEKEGFKI